MSTKMCPGAGAQARHMEQQGAFAQDRSRADGLAPYCKVCAATKQREWKHANPEKVKTMKAAYRKRELAGE